MAFQLLFAKKIDMSYCKKSLFLAGALTTVMMFSCSDDSDDPSQNPNPNPNNPPTAGDVSITGATDGVFWGEELTITGTGFSAVKEENLVKFLKLPPLSCQLQYTSAAGGDIEIISATTTALKIKVPLKLIQGNPSCGPLSADIEVTVKDKKDVLEGVTFGPLPYIGSFLYHYGWFDVPKVTKVGDSVMLDGGLLYTPVKGSEYWDKIRLSVNGNNVPIKFRSIGLESGWAFYLPAEEYAEMNCSQDPDGWGAREMEFKFSIEGTQKSASRMLYVQYLPERSTSCDVCPSNLSKLSGGNPEWVVKGKNLYYTAVSFATGGTCSGPPQEMDIVHDPWADEIRFTIPLSTLAAGCLYGVTLINECESKYIGQLEVTD
jgi:hypothetical protein